LYDPKNSLLQNQTGNDLVQIRTMKIIVYIRIHDGFPPQGLFRGRVGRSFFGLFVTEPPHREPPSAAAPIIPDEIVVSEFYTIQNERK